MNPSLPALLFYCQHSLGMGHLVRTLHLVDALREEFHVTLVSGGRMPPGVRVPAGVDLIDLPPLGMDDASNLISLDERYNVEQAKAVRRDCIMGAFRRRRPAVIVVELFPFGRKKFSDEILPLLEAAHSERPRPVVLCSLRDILVSDRRDQHEHDLRAVIGVNRHFDGILVHADPAFARLEDSCGAFAALRKPVHYTGFVSEPTQLTAVARDQAHILVSAGGGLVGQSLFETVLAAYPAVHARTGIGLRIVTGPFYPESDATRLAAMARPLAKVEVIRHLPSLTQEMQCAKASISQCGYNTAMDLVRTGVPALVVPYSDGRENEQMARARKMEQLGLLRMLPADQLSSDAMAGEMAALLAFQPMRGGLDLNGARESTRVARQLYENSLREGAQT